MSEIKHSFVRTNGIKMHVAEIGDGFPVVFCHGTPRDDNEVVLVDTRLDRWAAR